MIGFSPAQFLIACFKINAASAACKTAFIFCQNKNYPVRKIMKNF